MRTKLPKHGIVPVALNLEPDLTLADLKVYVALSSFQGSNDDAYPSRDSIVERTGLALETVSRAVSHLVLMKWVERIRRPNRSSIYRVMVDTEDFSEMTGSSLTNDYGNDSRVTVKMTGSSLPSIKQKEHSKRSGVSIFDEESEPFKLASLLLTEHQKLDRVFARGKEQETAQRWAKDIDKILRIDGRSVEDVRQTIVFSQASDFWCSNIVSGSKLREKFDTVFLQSKRTPKTTPLFPAQQSQVNTSRTDEQKAMDKAILEKLYADR